MSEACCGGAAQEVTDRLQQLMRLDASLRAALADKAPQKGGPRPSVNPASLVRGLRRRSWTGPAWLGSITENGQVQATFHAQTPQCSVSCEWTASAWQEVDWAIVLSRCQGETNITMSMRR